MKIKVAITDDHPMILEGLTTMLSRYDHITVSGAYSNGEELLEEIKRHTPDILLLDIQLPGKTGDELAPVLLEQYPEMKILVFTNFDSNMYATKMLWQGVHGYILKNVKEDMLIHAIGCVFEGNTFIDEAIRKKLDSNATRSRHILASKTALSIREKEVLEEIVNGLTDQEIAGKLFLGTGTVKFYRKRILLKLDAKNTAELVSKALRFGHVK